MEKNKQVKQLLNDVKESLIRKVNGILLEQLFTSLWTRTLLFERAVVDGQQRLITMFLIAHALKEIAKEEGETDISNLITTSYLENSASNEYKYRLRPSISDDDAYAYIAKRYPRRVYRPAKP